MAVEPIEVVFSFDTTGSMYPCLTQVRRNLRETITRLIQDVPGIRIGLMAHGDDACRTEKYDIKVCDLTNDKARLVAWVDSIESSYGGGPHANYERVLDCARHAISWSAGKSKVLVILGDEVPHGPSFVHNNGQKYDWRNDLGLLLEAGVQVHGVHCLPGIRPASKVFYQELANKTGGFYLTLDQFNSVTDLVLAICYKEAGSEYVEKYEAEVQAQGRMTRNLSNTFSTLLNRKAQPAAIKPSVAGAALAGRFQVLRVDADQDIASFVRDNGLSFQIGRGFYQFTKRVLVQDHKEVILVDKTTGDVFCGDQARRMAGIPVGITEKVKPDSDELENFECFIQSTSANRKLLGGTKFLYEVQD